MLIRRLELQNFAAFEALELELDEALTVLVGRNATGKSSILEALAIALGGFVSGFRSGKYDHPISPRVVRMAASGLAKFPCRVSAELLVGERSVRSTRELRSITGRTTTGESAELRGLAREMEEQLGSDSRGPLPVVAYYGPGRLWVHKRQARTARQAKGPTRVRKLWASPLRGYEAALDAASDPKGLGQWLSYREHVWLQAYATDPSVSIPRFADVEAVSRAACGCLEAATDLRYDIRYQELRVTFDDGRVLPFGRLSDGQRNLVALAADLAWRIMQLNGYLGAAALDQTRGVVLIDEVDLHLHPAWQWDVLANLRKIFPAVQFVVTTHAGPVISSAPAGTVRLLDGSRVVDVGSTAGKDINTLLRGLMGTGARPQAVQNALDELSMLVEDENIYEATRAADALAKDLGEDDPTIVAARWELKFASGEQNEKDQKTQ